MTRETEDLIIGLDSKYMGKVSPIQAERLTSDVAQIFIVKNEVKGKTPQELDDLIMHTAVGYDGELIGEGDKFKTWCEAQGRELPDDELVKLMNADPYAAKEWIRKDVPNHPYLWRNWSTYRSGKGRHNV